MADAPTFREYAERSGLCDQFGSPYDHKAYHTAMYSWEAACKARPTPSPPVAALPATPVIWGIWNSHGFYDWQLDEASAKDWCAHFSKHEVDPLKTYTCAPLYAQPQPQPAQPPYYFRRFVRGQERAEDVLVEKAATLDEAIKTAARICPAEAMTVLVLAPAPAWAITAPSTPTQPEVAP